MLGLVARRVGETSRLGLFPVVVEVRARGRLVAVFARALPVGKGDPAGDAFCACVGARDAGVVGGGLARRRGARRGPVGLEACGFGEEFRDLVVLDLVDLLERQECVGKRVVAEGFFAERRNWISAGGWGA